MKKNSIALGTWSWGDGPAGADQVFGNHTDVNALHEVFNTAMVNGLSLWDTAAVYGMGASENVLGSFIKDVKREDIEISTKFTPQIADNTEDAVSHMLEGSLRRLGIDYVDIYWIHNPMDVERWTPGLMTHAAVGNILWSS